MSEERVKRLVYDIGYILILAVLVGFGIYFMQRPRVGTLDMNRVISGLGIQNRLQEDERRWQNELMVRLDEFKEKLRVKVEPLNIQVDKAADEATRNKLREQIGLARREFQENAELIAQEYQRHGDEVRRNLRTKVDPSVRKVARSRHLDVIIDAEGGKGILYANKRVDVTEMVVEEVRKAYSVEDLVTLDQPATQVAPLPQRNTAKPVKKMGGRDALSSKSL